MKFKIESWTTLDFYKRRLDISFPIYQREFIWPEEKQRTFIDSIMRGLDIPKIYLYHTGKGYEVIDGNQRIQTLWAFFNEEFSYYGTRFHDLPEADKEKFENYKLTVAVTTDASDEDIRLLFERLQLGIPLNSGEKLNAIKSNLGLFVNELSETPFMKRVSIPSRRFAKEQVCAQILNNYFSLKRAGNFKNSKFDDLSILYREFSDFDLKGADAAEVRLLFEKLYEIFGHDTSEIRNRATVVTLFFFISELYRKRQIQEPDKVKVFVLTFLEVLKNEARLGIDATNRFLAQYQLRVVQGADSRISITERHEKMLQAYEFFLKSGKILNEQKTAS